MFVVTRSFTPVDDLLRYWALFSSQLLPIILYYIILYYIILYYIILYCIVLYCIVLYYIITSSLFRSDMSKPKDFYWGSLGRSINEIKLHAKGSKFSCAHQPLVNIPLQNVVLDELHLMLRITGQCLYIIITWVTMRLHIPKIL